MRSKQVFPSVVTDAILKTLLIFKPRNAATEWPPPDLSKGQGKVNILQPEEKMSNHG